MNSAWDASSQPVWLTSEVFSQKIQPLLAGVSTSAIGSRIIGGFFLQFGRRLGWVWVRSGAESSRSGMFASNRAPEMCPFAM